MTTRIQLRRGTAAQWTSADPVLALGEAGIETDTLLWKVGDGTTVWSELAYMESANENFGNVTVSGNISAGRVLTNNYLYANGAPVSFGANTGNITFSLSSISTNAANTGIDINANGSGYVNIASGNGGYSQLQNNDGSGNISFVWVEQGNAYIAGGENEWIFNKDGNLTIPGPINGTVNNTVSLNAFNDGGDPSAQILNWDVANSAPSTLISVDTNQISLVTNITGNTTYTWNVDNTGNLTFPDNSGEGWPVNTQRFGMGNIGAWLDGQWTIGEFSGNGVSGEFGIRIDPSIEGSVGMTFPSNGTSNTQPVQIYSTNGSGIELYTGSGGTWSFNSTGNLTLPDVANVSINYANGQPYGGSGGNADIGNWVFDANDATVNNSGYPRLFGGPSGGPELTYLEEAGNNASFSQTMYINNEEGFLVSVDYGNAQFRFGTDGNTYLPGNILGGGNLKLSPDFTNASAYLDVYLTAGPDIHVAGNGETVIVGRDDSANVAVNANGAVTIQTWDGAANTWTFGSDGTFTTPGTSGNITGANVIGANIISANTVTANTFSALGNLQLVAGEAVWTLLDNGQTIFPTLSVNLHNGGTQTGQVLQFGDGNQQAIITGPAPAVAGYNAQRLIIQGQNGGDGEGGDVYVWGGDSNVNGGDIKIYAGDADTAGIGGNIHITGGRGTTDAGEILITGGRNDGNVGARVDLTGGFGSTNGGNINLTGGYGALAGGPINITGGISGNGLANYGNVNIGAGASHWHFDNAGNLVLPNTGVIYETLIPTGGLEGKTIALKPYGGTSLDQQLLVYPTAGADFNHLHLTSGNLYNTELFLGNDDFYVKLANTGNVVINSNDDLGNSAQWTFDNTGAVTLPPALGPGSSAGRIQTANAYPTILAYGSGFHGGPELDWMNSDDPVVDFNNSSILRNTMYLNDEGLYIGINENYVDNVFSGRWLFDTAGNLNTPQGGYIGAAGIKGDGTMLTGGKGNIASLTSFYANVDALNYSSCVTANPDGTLNITTYGDGTGQLGQWTFSGADLTATGNISLDGGRITGGVATVVTDGINSIALGLGAQMDVFGFPFSVVPTRGQLTISGDITTTQAIGTWYYQAINTNTYQLYTDSTYTTLVDSSGWTAYGGGGTVAITKQTPAANVVINSNGFTSTFTNTGELDLPGALNIAGNGGDITMTGGSITGAVAVITTPTSYANLITPAAGARAFINDGNLVAAGNFGAVISDGGSNVVPVWSDGTDWYIG